MLDAVARPNRTFGSRLDSGEATTATAEQARSRVLESSMVKPIDRQVFEIQVQEVLG